MCQEKKKKNATQKKLLICPRILSFTQKLQTPSKYILATSPGRGTRGEGGCLRNRFPFLTPSPKVLSSKTNKQMPQVKCCSHLLFFFHFCFHQSRIDLPCCANLCCVARPYLQRHSFSHAIFHRVLSQGPGSGAPHCPGGPSAVLALSLPHHQPPLLPETSTRQLRAVDVSNSHPRPDT